MTAMLEAFKKANLVSDEEAAEISKQMAIDEVLDEDRRTKNRSNEVRNQLRKLVRDVKKGKVSDNAAGIKIDWLADKFSDVFDLVAYEFLSELQLKRIREA